MENTRNEDTVQEYTIVRMAEDNLKDLGRLYEAVYGRAAVPGFFLRKYDTVYTGAAWIGYIAYSLQQEPVAYYGVIPCFVEYNGQRVLAAQSADTMTHPGHRYKGMFAELSRLTFALCRETGIRLVFGFPNQHSYPGAIRMGWKETEVMDCFSISISALPLAMLAARWPFLKKWHQWWMRRTLSKYASNEKGVASSVLTPDMAGVQRSAQYIAYKQYSGPQVWQIHKAKVWVKVQQVLNIGDMEQVSESNFDDVMRTITAIARRLGIRHVFFHISPQTPLHRLWLERYNAIPSFPVLFQDFGAGIPLEKIKFTFADIDIF